MRFFNDVQGYLSKQIEMKLPKDGLMYKTEVEIEILIPVQIF